MGSIRYIYKPNYWTILKEGVSKISKDDIIYYMKIGQCDDYYIYDINIFISKINFENIISSKYFIKVIPYSEEVVKLFNENGEEISLVIGIENKNLERKLKNE